jgi:hypothetical protein
MLRVLGVKSKLRVLKVLSYKSGNSHSVLAQKMAAVVVLVKSVNCIYLCQHYKSRWRHKHSHNHSSKTSMTKACIHSIHTFHPHYLYFPHYNQILQVCRKMHKPRGMLVVVEIQ